MEAMDVLQERNIDIQETKLAEWLDPSMYLSDQLVDHNYSSLPFFQRFRLGHVLGQGSFGKVLKGTDIIMKRDVAVKCLKRRIEMLSKDDVREIIICKKLQELDPKNVKHIVKIFGYFTIRNYLCIVYNLMSSSVAKILLINDNQPFEIQQIKSIAYQLCCACSFLHENIIIHCDIKPDNILFEYTDGDFRYSKETQGYTRFIKNCYVELCDFGCAVSAKDSFKNTTGTINYIPPEHALKMDFSTPFDVWSMGVVLMELYQGRELFIGPKSKIHLLASMERVLGKIPLSLRKNYKGAFFEKSGSLDLTQISNCDLELIRINHKPLFEYKSTYNKEHYDFFDLVNRMLSYEPDYRITAKEALEHPFFKGMQEKSETN